MKRKVNVKKKAFLAEQVSAILQNNHAVKYKDSGCPTVSCVIGKQKINQALLDLRACVNLLPYSVFQALNLGELKPTFVTLLLVDRSVKVSKGIVEDVLVQVDKFIYPVDFIVFDTQPVEICNSIPAILGRPFLATSNALINYRNGIMKLAFENISLELNVFNMCKQPHEKEEEENEEANLVESILEEHVQEGSFSDPMETCLVNSLESSMQLEPELSNRYSLLDCAQVMENKGWKPQVDELRPSNESKQENECKLELKP